MFVETIEGFRLREGADTPHLNPLPYTTTASHPTRLPQGERNGFCLCRGYGVTKWHENVAVRGLGTPSLGVGATRCCGQLGAPIHFCETNPFYVPSVFDVSISFTEPYAVCRGICKWVRFGKRTHFRGGLKGLRCTKN